MYAAALQHQDEERTEVMAKMVEHAKKLESRAADRIQAALDQELGHATNGKNMHKDIATIHLGDLRFFHISICKSMQQFGSMSFYVLFYSKLG